jgi:hypothetical protein
LKPLEHRQQHCRHSESQQRNHDDATFGELLIETLLHSRQLEGVAERRVQNEFTVAGRSERPAGITQRFLQLRDRRVRLVQLLLQQTRRSTRRTGEHRHRTNERDFARLHQPLLVERLALKRFTTLRGFDTLKRRL